MTGGQDVVEVSFFNKIQLPMAKITRTVDIEGREKNRKSDSYSLCESKMGRGVPPLNTPKTCQFHPANHKTTIGLFTQVIILLGDNFHNLFDFSE